MNYRNMQLSDNDGVMALWRECDGVSLGDADLPVGIDRYLERNPGLSFVALRGNRIVGTIMSGDDGKRGYIQHLAVATKLRIKGVGSHLVEHCLDALKSQGIIISHVHVLNQNKSGREFWTRLGWMQRAEIVMYSFINGDNINA